MNIIFNIMLHGKTVAVAVTFAVGLGVLVGCRSSESYRKQADEAAYNIIDRQQKAVFDEKQKFDVRSPALQLRRQLLLDQHLPTSFAGSRGVRHIEAIPELENQQYLREETGEEAPPWLERTGEKPMKVTLKEALQIAARNSYAYQDAKEEVFTAALSLDLERDAFRNSWQGLLSSSADTDLSGDETVSWAEYAASLDLSRRFTSGMLMTAQLGVNLVQLLTGSRDSSLGIFGDASVSVPLMRGSGRFVVTEPMKQAERNVVYTLYDFERFRRSFAVRVASEYLGVLQQRDRVRNAEENYRGLVASARRARRLADMGRLPESQVDQATQDELRARDRWIAAVQALESSRDSFKQLLGLPTDARVAPDPEELERLNRLTEELSSSDGMQPEHRESVAADAPINLEYPDRAGGGPLEMDPGRAVEIAFNNRLDLRVALGRIDDAQRNIVVEADALRADLTLLGDLAVGDRRGLGTTGEPNADLRFEKGQYGGALNLDLPFERTQERNNYRRSWIELEENVRNAQQLEDEIKFDVRDGLRVLLETRETVKIQMRAVEVARRRVRGTELFVQQGRAEIRDVLEARESLISAENALTGAIVRYRVAELEFQRDLGVLKVNADGLWQEYNP